MEGICLIHVLITPCRFQFFMICGTTIRIQIHVSFINRESMIRMQISAILLDNYIVKEIWSSTTVSTFTPICSANLKCSHFISVTKTRRCSVWHGNGNILCRVSHGNTEPNSSRIKDQTFCANEVLLIVVEWRHMVTLISINTGSSNGLLPEVPWHSPRSNFTAGH